MTKLYIMTGPAGCGKSTWIKQNLPNAKVVSRDAIRFVLIENEDEYFSHENEVFKTFVSEIQKAIDNEEAEVVADATHLTPKARRLVLGKLNGLENVEVIAVSIQRGLNTCLEQNAQRRGLARVPDTIVTRMWNSYIEPTMVEEYIDKVIVYKL